MVPLGPRHICNLFRNEKKSFYCYFSFSLSRPGQPSSTYECIAGNGFHVDEKVHQSDTREIISLIRSFFFFLVKKYRERGKEKQRERKKKRRRRRSVRTALMTKHSFITTATAIASTTSSTHLSTSSKTI